VVDVDTGGGGASIHIFLLQSDDPQIFGKGFVGGLDEQVGYPVFVGAKITRLGPEIVAGPIGFRCDGVEISVTEPLRTVA